MAKKSSVKKTAWTYFAHYIRRKECKETTGDYNFGICCTCGKVKNFALLDAGHFVSGRVDSILFDEDMVHIQCVGCNRYKSGMWPEYYEYMIDRYGEDATEEIRKRKFENKSLTIDDIIDTRNHYKGLLKEIGFWPIGG